MSRRTFQTEKYTVATGYDRPHAGGPIHLTIFDKVHEENTGEEKIVYDHLFKDKIEDTNKLVEILEKHGIKKLPENFLDHLNEDIATEMMNGGRRYGVVNQEEAVA